MRRESFNAKIRHLELLKGELQTLIFSSTD